MQDNKTVFKSAQNIILENRKHLNISGVEDINNFNEDTISVLTNMGSLIVKGTGLKLDKFSVETGEVSIMGKIDKLIYDHSKINKRKNIIANIIK